MKTAIIVSGILRECLNAEPSWPWSGDRYLITQSTFEQPRTNIAIGPIDLEPTRHLFKDVMVRQKVDNFNIVNNVLDKWAAADELIKEDYDFYLFIRPDLYVQVQLPLPDDFFPSPNTLYITNETHKDDAGNVFINDLLFGMGRAEFKKFTSEIKDYYTRNTISIHELLYHYALDANFKFSYQTLCHYNGFPLRPNTVDMFENHKLLTKYTVNDLIGRCVEWNKSNGLVG